MALHRTEAEAAVRDVAQVSLPRDVLAFLATFPEWGGHDQYGMGWHGVAHEADANEATRVAFHCDAFDANLILEELLMWADKYIGRHRAHGNHWQAGMSEADDVRRRAQVNARYFPRPIRYVRRTVLTV